jgi:hypothetical protein
MKQELSQSTEEVGWGKLGRITSRVSPTPRLTSDGVSEHSTLTLFISAETKKHLGMPVILATQEAEFRRIVI